MTSRIDYSTLITLDTATPIAAGRMFPDGRDIRVFSDAAHTQALPFYIENINAADTRLWVKTDHATGRLHPDVHHYWRLDGDGVDEISAANGTPVSTSTVPGQVGQALSFNGTTSEVNLPLSVSSDLGGESQITVECWVNRNVLGTSHTIIGIGTNTGAPGAVTKLSFSLRSTNTVIMSWRSQSSDAGSSVESETGAFTTIGEWVHVAASLDLVAEIARIWINGLSVAVTGVNDGPLVFNNSNTFFDSSDSSPNFPNIGNSPDAFGASPFDGEIDNLAMYYRALTSDEIRSSYLRGLAGKQLAEPQPTAHWTLNSIDNAGSEIVDIVNGHNATIAGGVTVGQPSRLGQAMLFDGTTGYLSVPDHADLEPHTGASGTSTFAATITWNGAANQQAIWHKGVSGEALRFYIDSGRVALDPATVNGTNRRIHLTDVLIPVDTTVHVVGVFDNSQAVVADKYTFYIDGVSVPHSPGFTSGSVPVVSDLATAFEIGARAGGGFDLFWEDKIHDFLWSSDLLTATQIAELARRSKEGLRPDLTDPLLGILGYWSLDNRDIGIDPQDIAGQSHGVNNGPALVGQPGPIGQAMDFSAFGEEVEVAPNSAINIFGLTGHTRTAWVNIRTVGGTNGRVFDKATLSVEGYSSNVGDGPSLFSIAAFHYNTGTDPNSRTEAIIPINTWTHFAAVWDSTGNDYVIYINGEVAPLQTQIIGTGIPEDDSADPLFMGGRPILDRHFDGLLSDMAIYQQALTASQVSDLYEKGRAGFASSSSVSKAFVTYGNPNLSSASSKSTTFIREITGLVTAYEFDEDEGGPVVATLGTDATLVGNATPTTSTFGNARQLEGEGVFDIAAPVIPVGNATISTTIRTEATTAQTLLANYDGYTDNSGSALEMTADGYVQFRNSTGTGADNVLVTGLVSINDGITHSVLVTKDNSTASIYVDGVLDNSAAMSADTTADANFRIGSYKELPFIAPTGMVLRLEADQISVSSDLDADGRVTDWPDLSVSSNNASQSTAADRPIYLPEGIGGRPAVILGDFAEMDLASFNLSDFAVFAAIETISEHNTIDTAVLFGSTLSGDPSGGGGIGISGPRTGTITDETIIISWSTDATLRAAAVTNLVQPPGTKYLLRATLNGVAEGIAIDGTPGSITEGLGGLDSGAGETLENIDRIGRSNGSLSYKIGALLMFDGAMSAADIAYVERYLSLKYGTDLITLQNDTRASVTIDDLRVFSRVLTAPEITDLAGGFGEVSGNSVLVRTRLDPDPSARNTGTTVTGF